MTSIPSSLELPQAAPGWDRRDALALIAIAALAAALRFVLLDKLPPALWYDEGLNGFDAWQVARGRIHPMIFSNVAPQAPGLEYWLAPFILVFGNTAFALRLAPAFIGTLAPPLLYLWMRLADNRRAALFGGLFLAGLRWHFHFSRLVFHTVFTPTLALAFCVCLWLALRNKSRIWAALAGLFWVSGFYAYLSWYFVAPVFFLVAVVAAIRQIPRGRRAKLTAPFLVTAAIAIAPLAIHYLRIPADFTGRVGQVSLFSEGLGPGLRAAAKNLGDASLMLFWRGDHVPKQNIPWKPALDWMGAILVGAGLVWAARNMRRSLLALTLLGWLIAGTLPTVFSKTDSPNFLRTLVVTGALGALGGIGADRISALFDRVMRRTRNGDANLQIPNPGRPIGGFIGGIAILCSTAMSVSLYFLVWPKTPDLFQQFSGHEYNIAVKVRGTNQTAFLPQALMDHWSIQYILAEKTNVRVFTPAAFEEAMRGGDPIFVVESPRVDPAMEPILRAARGRKKDIMGFEYIHVLGEPSQGAWARGWTIVP